MRNLPIHLLNQKGFLHKEFGLVNLFMSICIISIITSSIFILEINLLKQTKREISNITENNNLLLCNTFIHTNIHNKANLNNISNYVWYDNLSHVNENLRSILDQKTVSKNILPESSILETLEYSLPVFKKENNLEEGNSYTTKHGIFLKKIPNNFFLLLDPWNSVIIESTFDYSSKTSNNENIYSILLKSEPKIRSYFNSNINIRNYINLKAMPWLMQVKNYGIIYLSKNKILEYSSLLNEDKQPICRNLSQFLRESEECTITSKINNKVSQKFTCKNNFPTKFDKIEALLKWN
jgi:hypothetical protein